MQKGIGASDPNIHLELIGTKAMSGPVKVKTGWLGALRRPHRRQVCDDLIVESSEDLGDILVVVLGNNNGWFTDQGTPWYVKYVRVYSDNKEVVFPCYHWIGDEEHIHFTAHTSKSSSYIDLLFPHLNRVLLCLFQGPLEAEIHTQNQKSLGTQVDNASCLCTIWF